MPKESVLVAGPPGSGKTTWLWQMIFNHIPEDQPVWLFDSEKKLRGVMELFATKVPKNVTILDAVSVSDIVIALEDEIYPVLDGEAEGYGVVGIDMVDKWWEKAQEHWVDVMHDGKKNFAEHIETIVKRKKDRGDRSPSQFEDSFIDWPVIKKWHNGRMIEPLLYEQPCHVLATTATREIRGEGPMAARLGGSGRLARWETINQMAEGEKRNDFRFTTILGVQNIGLANPEYQATLIKDRTRKLGKPTDLYVRQPLIPDDNGIHDLWTEFSSRTGAPKSLEPSE